MKGGIVVDSGRAEDEAVLEGGGKGGDGGRGEGCGEDLALFKEGEEVEEW